MPIELTVGSLFAAIRLLGTLRETSVMVQPPDDSASHKSSSNSFARAAASCR